MGIHQFHFFLYEVDMKQVSASLLSCVLVEKDMDMVSCNYQLWMLNIKEKETEERYHLMLWKYSQNTESQLFWTLRTDLG